VSPGPAPVPKLPERRRLSRRVRDALLMTLMALAAFAVGLWVFNSAIMPQLIHASAEVRVPDLSNLSYEQAEKLLAGQQLRLGRSGERFDASVPRGFILAQDPLPDTPVRVRRRIMVMVSEGEEFSAVPEMVGSSPRGAALAIDHAGLGFAGTTRAPSDDVGEGMVAGPPARREGWRTRVLRYPSTARGIPGVLMMRGLGAPGDSGRTASVRVGATC